MDSKLGLCILPFINTPPVCVVSVEFWGFSVALARGRGNTQGNHEVRALQQPPNAAHAERAISKHPPPPLPLQGAHVLHKGGGCTPRAGGSPPRGWQQGRDQPTAHGTAQVVRRCEIPARGGQAGGTGVVHERGTQERQRTGEGATQTHRTREPHQEGQGRAQQTRRRGTARQERQPEQREQGTRREGMGERDNVWRNRAPGPHAHRNTARQAMDGLWTEARGQQKQSNDPGNNQHIPNTPTIGRR